ncbi:MAG: hypothetical protein EBU08_06200 [Micrococcales bacterium]|nr:hypothetical protein [Micrococcales bacterium]
MNNEFAIELYKDLTRALAHPGYREEDLYIVVTKKLQRLEDDLVDELTKMIKHWEAEVPDDTTLYTLGLRQAIDLIQGNDPL